MEKFYEDHRIEVSASLDGDCWSVSLFIYYQEEATNILVTFSLDESFTSYNGAVEAGLAAAQNWIDWRKPTKLAPWQLKTTIAASSKRHK
jgi:hypothetical protein